MNLKNRYAAVAAAACVTAALMSVAISADAEPGYSTANDPLVTLSYIENLRYEMRTELKEELKAELTEQIRNEMKNEIKSELLHELGAENLVTEIRSSINLDSLLGDVELRRAEIESMLTAGNVNYKVISLSRGQSLMCSGTCELILRSGEAVAVVTNSENVAGKIGLSDLTSGSELTDDSFIPRNHYIIIPRGDGRGLTVTSDVAYILARGEYTLE